MGPIALFDKSFLQSLSEDESVWFDQFFMAVVCPIFFLETLANLAKESSSKGPPEKIVGVIASRFPEFGGKPVAHHVTLCQNDLLGAAIPMRAQIPMDGARPVLHQGKPAAVFKESPTAAAFSRWMHGDFNGLERDFAKKWRASLDAIDLRAIAAKFKRFGLEGKRFGSLDDVKSAIDELISSTRSRFDMMELAVTLAQLPPERQRSSFDSWTQANRPSLKQFAPFAAHVTAVELFFQLAINSDLISPDRNSNRMDIAYLFYLPFCMTFVSSDKLHRKCASLFMRPDQSFTWGIDLKADLAQLNRHYLQLPEDVRDKGISHFASQPPPDWNGTTTDIWDQHFPKWREKKKEESTPEELKKVFDRLKDVGEAPPIPLGVPMPAADDLNIVALEHMVQKKKGSWFQLPKHSD
ncbi:hypothetical protein hmeg3_14745 [Herbaspirillum sp. meg3]|uniref:hypothetical protein n=1 Tax=Herbaspirillum sp. meg3 TaxID=2025949 RepID=UPI000B995B7F|nr:hypothetical protein [Herbaspirillum sp. meg3]ASU39424.1 hypothetical protein hmeg3_14745 [Herbaspirillum sp. meg3]